MKTILVAPGRSRLQHATKYILRDGLCNGPNNIKQYFWGVEQIKRVRINQGRLDRLLSSSDVSIPPKTLQRVVEVVESARRNATIKSNEETLRLRMEPLIFGRLQSETDW